MSSLGLSRGWAHAPDTLDPPPTPEELVWWDEHKVSLLRNEVIKGTLVMQVPFIAGIVLTRGWHGMLSSGGLAALGGWVLITGLAALGQWRLVRKGRFHHELIARRLRAAIAAPDAAAD